MTSFVGPVSASGAAALAALVCATTGRVPLAAVLLGVALVAGWAALALLYRADRAHRYRITELDRLATLRADQVAMLNHEIRTPLAVIQGAAELLAESPAGSLDDRQRTFVGRIVTNSAQVNALAEQLLIRARLEAGLFTVHPVRFDLRRHVREIVDELAQVLPETTVVLDALGAPVVVHADPQLVRQVVVNLANNAARSGAESNRVEISIVRGDEAALVSVSDGGRGMTDEQRDQLFRRFASGRPLGNGTGIGLYLSGKLIELHGGRFFVDTITGRGTTMHFTLPTEAGTRDR